MDDSILMRQRLARVLSNVSGVQIVGEALDADYFFDKSAEFLHIPVVVGELAEHVRQGRGPSLTLN